MDDISYTIAATELLTCLENPRPTIWRKHPISRLPDEQAQSLAYANKLRRFGFMAAKCDNSMNVMPAPYRAW